MSHGTRHPDESNLKGLPLTSPSASLDDRIFASLRAMEDEQGQGDDVILSPEDEANILRMLRGIPLAQAPSSMDARTDQSLHNTTRIYTGPSSEISDEDADQVMAALRQVALVHPSQMLDMRVNASLNQMKIENIEEAIFGTGAHTADEISLDEAMDEAEAFNPTHNGPGDSRFKDLNPDDLIETATPMMVDEDVLKSTDPDEPLVLDIEFAEVDSDDSQAILEGQIIALEHDMEEIALRMPSKSLDMRMAASLGLSDTAFTTSASLDDRQAHELEAALRSIPLRQPSQMLDERVAVFMGTAVDQTRSRTTPFRRVLYWAPLVAAVVLLSVFIFPAMFNIDNEQSPVEQTGPSSAEVAEGNDLPSHVSAMPDLEKFTQLNTSKTYAIPQEVMITETGPARLWRLEKVETTTYESEDSDVTIEIEETSTLIVTSEEAIF